MFLEEKDINSQLHDSKIHQWLKQKGWQICRARRARKIQGKKYFHSKKFENLLDQNKKISDVTQKE